MKISSNTSLSLRWIYSIYRVSGERRKVRWYRSGFWHVWSWWQAFALSPWNLEESVAISRNHRQGFFEKKQKRAPFRESRDQNFQIGHLECESSSEIRSQAEESDKRSIPEDLCRDLRRLGHRQPLISLHLHRRNEQKKLEESPDSPRHQQSQN